MKSEFRPTTPEDAASIRKFFENSRGDGSNLAQVEAATMAWKYWSPHPFWDGSRSYVLKRDGEIAAHGAVVPARCVLGQDRFRAFHLIDWVASPDAQGAGVSLFRRIQQLADATYVVGGSAMTQQILPVLGFQDLGTATKFARPLRPLKRFTAAPVKNWRTVAQAARSALWSARAPGELPARWAATALTKEELDGVQWPVAAGVFFEHAAGAFAYMLASPAGKFRFYRVGPKSGYFCLAVGIAQVRIVDAWINSESLDDWRDLYLTAVTTARAEPGAVELVTMASDDRTRQALSLAGFHARGESPIRFFSKTRKVDALRFQMMDSDAAYLGLQQLEFWA